MTSAAPKPSPWWDRSRHADRRLMLEARMRSKSAIRHWFESGGFTEVEPGCLQRSPGNETHLHGFKSSCIGTDLNAQVVYLHTSPEFAMKKLLAAGETKIFAFAPVFRNRERGPLHAPEFTMLEWYRAHSPYDCLFADCAKLIALAWQTTGHALWDFRGKTCDASLPCRRITVADAFATYANVDLVAALPADDSNDAMRDARAQLVRAAAQIRLDYAADDSWSDLFSRILTQHVEPNLGLGQPDILTDYPIVEAALARAKPGNPKLAERFEVYACGVELANGFGELSDPTVQRQRFERAMRERQRIYGESYPIDEDFLAALALMPAASGCALGFDRLMMLATGATHIDQVIWTPFAL